MRQTIWGQAICGATAAYYNPQVTYFLHEQLFTRAANTTAITTGQVLGALAGGWTGVKVAGQYWLAPTFVQYSTKVRALTNQTYRANQHLIDPDNLRGAIAGFDLDHWLSVKCGWYLGAPADLMASTFNLQMLPSSVNRSLGSVCNF